MLARGTRALSQWPQRAVVSVLAIPIWFSPTTARAEFIADSLVLRFAPGKDAALLPMQC